MGRSRTILAISILLLVSWTVWLQYQLRNLHGKAEAHGTISEASSPAPSSLRSPPPPPPPPSPTTGMATASSPTNTAAGCPSDCHAMPGTELPGDVVQWGADHLVPSAADCCSACKKTQGCNSWVWCGHAAQCGGAHKQCWLKKRPDPYEDTDVLTGRSTKWTSGVVGSEPPRDPQAADGGGKSGPSAVCDFALLTVEGLVRMRLRPQAKNAARYVAALLDELRAKSPPGVAAGSGKAPAVDPARPVRDGLRFYRAEPVPARWGSLDWPDNYLGGRWGPPYALLQGSLRPTGTRITPAAPDAGPGAKPIIRRGMVAWAGGGGGPDFFVALAQHPEWCVMLCEGARACAYARQIPFPHAPSLAPSLPLPCAARISTPDHREQGQRAYRMGRGRTFRHGGDRCHHAPPPSRRQLGLDQRHRADHAAALPAAGA